MTHDFYELFYHKYIVVVKCVSVVSIITINVVVFQIAYEDVRR